MEGQKRSRKWLWIIIGLAVVGLIAGWCTYFGNQSGVSSVFNLNYFLMGLFIVTVLGYLLGRITIKGVSLGTAGVFLIAILFGYLCTLIPSDVAIVGGFHLDSTSKTLAYYKGAVQNVGLVLFVSSVGLIAGPKFFRDLGKNFKTYILMGAIIILSGTAVAIGFALIPGIGSEFSAGVLSGALTSTPGYSAAVESAGAEAAKVTLGYAIAYPFGVVGVVLFVQLLPKVLKANMEVERGLLKSSVETKIEKKEGLIQVDDFGLAPLALAIVCGLILGGIRIPLSADGYASGAPVFSLTTTGGVLIMCLVFGHFGRIGKFSLEVPTKTAKTLRELGLMLFLIGAGVDGGVQLVSQIKQSTLGGLIVVYGLLAGAVMTTVPMFVGYFVGGKLLKLPMLNNLGSITGGMTSTPALGTLINTAETEDVAGAYASTYPIALVLIVLACNLMIGLI